MNELLFLMQVFIITSSALIALRLGAHALVAFVCISSLLANLFVLKQITLFNTNATGSDAFAIGATLGLNLIQEYVGKKLARQTIWFTFFFLLFYLIMSQLHLSFSPSPFDSNHRHYAALLDVMPRIAIASFSTFLIAQMCDYLLYGFLRKLWHKRFIVVRNMLSLLTSQLIDTVLFTYLALYGIIEELNQIILISYTIKVIVIVLSSPFIKLAARIAHPHKITD